MDRSTANVKLLLFKQKFLAESNEDQLALDTLSTFFDFEVANVIIMLLKQTSVLHF